MLEDLRMELSEGKKLLYMDLTHEGPGSPSLSSNRAGYRSVTGRNAAGSKRRDVAAGSTDLLMALVHKLTLFPVHLYLPLLPPLLWC